MWDVPFFLDRCPEMQLSRGLKETSRADDFHLVLVLCAVHCLDASSLSMHSCSSLARLHCRRYAACRAVRRCRVKWCLSCRVISNSQYPSFIVRCEGTRFASSWRSGLTALRFPRPGLPFFDDHDWLWHYFLISVCLTSTPPWRCFNIFWLL